MSEQNVTVNAGSWTYPIKAGRHIDVPKGPLTNHVPVRFDRATIDAVKLWAERDGMTVSSWIRHLVRSEVARRNAQAGATGEGS